MEYSYTGLGMMLVHAMTKPTMSENTMLYKVASADKEATSNFLVDAYLDSLETTLTDEIDGYDAFAKVASIEIGKIMCSSLLENIRKSS